MYHKKNYIIIVMNIKTSQTLVSEALNEIKTISPDNAYEMSENNQ